MANGGIHGARDSLQPVYVRLLSSKGVNLWDTDTRSRRAVYVSGHGERGGGVRHGPHASIKFIAVAIASFLAIESY